MQKKNNMNYETLLTRGFTKDEARKTVKILEQGKNKSIFKEADAWMNYVLLIVAIIGNMIIAIMLVPFLLAFKTIPLYITIALIAVMFGYLFATIIRGLDEKARGGVIAGLFLPAIALINSYFMVEFANFVTTTLTLPNEIHSPIIITAIYTSAFIAPFLFHKLTAPKKWIATSTA